MKTGSKFKIIFDFFPKVDYFTYSIYQFFSTWIPSIWLLSVFAVVWFHRSVVHSEDYSKPTKLLKETPDHNTGSSMPYSLWIVCGFFYVPQNCEHLRAVRQGLWFIVLIGEDLKVLIIYRCNYKGSTFSSVILRPWVLVKPELTTSRIATWCSTNWATSSRII